MGPSKLRSTDMKQAVSGCGRRQTYAANRRAPRLALLFPSVRGHASSAHSFVCLFYILLALCYPNERRGSSQLAAFFYLKKSRRQINFFLCIFTTSKNDTYGALLALLVRAHHSQKLDRFAYPQRTGWVSGFKSPFNAWTNVPLLEGFALITSTKEVGYLNFPCDSPALASLIPVFRARI